MRQPRFEALAVAIGKADATAYDHDGRIEQQLQVLKKPRDHIDRAVDDGGRPNLAARGSGEHGWRVNGMT